MKRLFIGLMLALLVGCSSSTAVKKDSLIPLRENIPTIVLKEDIVFHMGRPGTEYLKMSSGDYVAFASDKGGTYFLGPDRCLGYFSKSNQKYFSQPCGIYSSYKDESWKVIELPDYTHSSGSSVALDVGAQYGAVGATTSYGLQKMMESYDQQRIFFRKFIIDKENTDHEFLK